MPLFGGDLLLGEVRDGVAAVLVALAHDVEEEGVDVVVERLVVEEELGEQAQVLGGIVLANKFPLSSGLHIFDQLTMPNLTPVLGMDASLLSGLPAGRMLSEIIRSGDSPKRVTGILSGFLNFIFTGLEVNFMISNLFVTSD